MSLVEANKLQKAGKHKIAVKLYRQVLAEQPKNVEAYEGLANGLYCIKDFDGALEAADKAEELNSSSFKPHLTRFAVYYDQKQIEMASKEIAIAMELAPDSPEVLCSYGAFCYMQEEPDNAIASLVKALEIDPENYCARRNLGIIYSLKKDYGSSFTEVLKAFRIRPNPKSLSLVVRVFLARYRFFVVGAFLLMVLVGIAAKSILLIAPFFILAIYGMILSAIGYFKQSKLFWGVVDILGVVVCGGILYWIISWLSK
jgi:tetratricopeptide (TPR) repeat protein